MGSDTFHAINRFIGALTPVGPRLASMEESLYRQAALRNAVIQSPEGRAGILAGDPETLKLMRYGGGDVDTAPFGPKRMADYPQLSPADEGILPHITTIPHNFPPQVMTTDLAKIERDQAEAEQTSFLTRLMQQYYQGGGASAGGGMGNLVPTQMKLGPLTLGLPPPPVTVPQEEQPVVPRGEPIRRPAAGAGEQPPAREPQAATTPAAQGDPRTARGRSGQYARYTDEQTGESITGTFGRDGMSFTADDGTPYVFDEQAQKLLPSPAQPRGGTRTPAAEPAAPGTQAQEPPPQAPVAPAAPGAAQAAPPPPPATAPGLQQDRTLLFGPEEPEGTVGYPSYAPGPSPPLQLPAPAATPGAPGAGVAPSRVQLLPARPTEKGGPRSRTTGVIEKQETKPSSGQIEDMAAAADNDPRLARYLQDRGLTYAEALRDRRAVGMMRRFLGEEAGRNRERLEQSKLQAGEKGQIKRIRALRIQTRELLEPVPGNNPEGIRPVDIGAATPISSEFSKFVTGVTEDIPVVRSIARQFTMAGEGVPGAPEFMETMQQTEARGGPKGKAAARFRQLVAGSAPQLVKAFGDTGQLSQQEQTVARENLFPSPNDSPEARVNKAQFLLHLFDLMEEALLQGASSRDIHDMATDAAGLGRSEPTRRVGRGAGETRRQLRGGGAEPAPEEEE